MVLAEVHVLTAAAMLDVCRSKSHQLHSKRQAVSLAWLTTTTGCSTRRTSTSSCACCQPGDCAVELPTKTCSRQQCSVAPGGACCCSDLSSRSADHDSWTKVSASQATHCIDHAVAFSVRLTACV
jgi:hypothetical protein